MAKAGEKSSRPEMQPSSMSVDQFVSLMSPLIDSEKEAEISASIGLSTDAEIFKSLDSAQKKGPVLLNLKCTDSQTGLMGKVLLEFQSNKGDLLPAHKAQLLKNGKRQY